MERIFTAALTNATVRTVRACATVNKNMRWQSVVILFLLALVGAGWWHGWRRPGEAEVAEFTQRRIAFLENENQRLTQALLRLQNAQEVAEDNTQRAEIEKKVATLRSLQFRQRVHYREIPRSDLPAILRQKLVQQVPDKEFAADGVALTALGLLPPGIDLKKTYLSLLGEQVGAFYDQHTQELFTFSGQSLANSQNRVILAHELTHALEDQHFHLANLPLEAKGNDDRAMAASAVVEGDATLVMNQYLLGDLSTSTIQESLASAFTTDVRQLATAPRYLREGLVFPYLKGQIFCQTLYDHGGWSALSDAFRRPPASTAEILHPERYLAVPRWRPVPVMFPDTAAKGGKPSADNVLGEFGVRQLLATWNNGTVDEVLAAAWLGDRYLVYAGSGKVSYLWRSVWADAGDANRMAIAARVGLGKRYGIAPVVETEGQENSGAGSKEMVQFTFSARTPNGRELKVVQAGKTLTLLDTEDPSWMAALTTLAATATPDGTKAQ